MGSFWSVTAGLLFLAVDIAASVHAVLHKRDTRAAIGWVGLIWLTPGFGVVLLCAFRAESHPPAGG